MLQLSHIRKAYKVADFTQVALDDVSVSFRDNEFAAILGPSGSGKTTLLNILGGLDHADSGDIVINGVSTTHYTDRDWDAYRNHRIGFIFQSYNLIPHQSVAANVELALTLAGLPATERRAKALRALKRVGLEEHADKRPNQLSGGQMQRVAIARALVNDPDIVLADEPTGALDTDTGIQVMDLLAEIARDRLVVMVTHNPELAEEYATRIVRLRDGRIVDDTDPLETDAQAQVPLVYGVGRGGKAKGARHAGPRPAAPRTKASVDDATRHASMSFLTALALSFNNLMTKKGRTFMTAFAGSIGIIGIAAILALSNGVNDYIARTEEEALSSYPLTITKSSFDLTSLMVANMAGGSDEAEVEDERLIPQETVMSDVFAQVKNNDLRAFRAFLESGSSGMEPYVNSIQYSYGLQPQIFKADTSKGIVKLNPSRSGSLLTNGLSGSAFLGGTSMSSFTQLLDDQRLTEQSLELVEGRWPEAYDECLLVLGRNGAITDYTLYSLGVYDTKVMDDMMTKALAGEEVEVPETGRGITMDEALELHFKVVPACNLYRKNAEQGTWTDMTSDKAYMRQLLANEAVDLHVVGIVKRSGNGSSSTVGEGIAYTQALTLHLMEVSQKSTIVAEQKAKPAVDVFTGKTFEELADEEGQNFDMESMFEVDEEALRQAFTFDESALEGLGQGMDLDFSNMDLDLSGMDLSSMDLSSMDTSKMASVFDEDTMRKIMANAPAFSMEGLDLGLDTSQIDLTDEQRTKINGALEKLTADFVRWASEHPELFATQEGEQPQVDYAKLFETYLNDENSNAQTILAPVAQDLQAALGEKLGQQVAGAMNTYVQTQLLPYLIQTIMANPALLAGGADEETMAQIIAGAPQFTMEGINLIGAGGLTDEQRETINQAADALGADFAAWLMKNPELLTGQDSGEECEEKPGEEKPGEETEQDESQTDYAKLMETYLKTDSAQKIIAPVVSELGAGVGEQMEAAIGSAMSSYMTEQFAPYIAQAMGGLMETAAKTMAAELGKAVAQGLQAQMAAAMGQVGQQIGGAIASQMEGTMSQLSDAMQNGFSVDADAFARAIQFNMTQEDLASLLSNYMNADELTYEGNLTKLGFAEQDNPDSISIYPKDFEAKEAVLEIVDDYNARMEKQGRDDATIQYSDIAGVLMSSVTDIVNTISLVLIAFVSISLVVSSIMISIITYISVLERKKEIGILRAMGASKLNVANIFNAETVIEGFFAGVLAIAVVYAVSVPVNEIVYRLKDVPNIMQLKPDNAVALVCVSVVLTLVAGLIPSSAAARRDPVEALRSE